MVDRSATLLLLAVLCAGAAGCGSAPQNAKSIFPGSCGEDLGKPATILLDCASHRTELMRLDWKRWGDATATATGQLVVCENDCDASGPSDTYRVIVTASHPRTCGPGRDSYTQLDYRPAGTSRDTAPPVALGTHHFGCRPGTESGGA